MSSFLSVQLRRIWSRRRDKRITGASGLGLAALVAAAVALISIPFVTALYPPDTYGTFALLVAIGATVATACTGRYEMLCVVAPHTEQGEREAWAAARLSLYLAGSTGALGLAVAAAVILTQPESLSESARAVWALAPLVTVLGAVTVVQTMLDTRLARYQLLAMLNVARAVILAGGQIALGHWEPTILSLTVPLLLSGLPSVVRIVYIMRSSPGDIEASYWAFMKTHRKYPLLQVPAAFANILSGNVILFALTAAYGTTSAGLFAIATRLVAFPSSVVGSPVNTVYFREASRLSGDRTLSLRLYARVVMFLVATGILGFALLWALVPTLSDFLGPDWTAAQAMIVATLPLGLALYLTAPPNSALIAHGNQGQLLIWRIALVIAPPALILMGPTLDWTDVVAAGAASMALLIGTVGYVLWGVRVIRGTGIHDESAIRNPRPLS